MAEVENIVIRDLRWDLTLIERRIDNLNDEDNKLLTSAQEKVVEARELLEIYLSNPSQK